MYTYLENVLIAGLLFNNVDCFATFEKFLHFIKAPLPLKGINKRILPSIANARLTTINNITLTILNEKQA